jgi:3-dehydroquinate synthase
MSDGNVAHRLVQCPLMKSNRRELESVRVDQRFALELAYPVLFTEQMFESGNGALREVLTADSGRARVMVVIDGGLADAQPDLASAVRGYFAAHATALELVGEPLVVQGGEQAKSGTHVVDRVLAQLFAARMDRHAYLLALGGGAMLDAVGYAAALFHRGMRLVRAPSTVLAQDDAGIGVKNGVNAFGVKNALGTFAPPHAVINDFDLLRTLPLRDHIAGLAEAIKVALIRDAAFFDWIEREADALRSRDSEATRYVIQRCAELHLAHIRGAGDPYETGSARPLDFGHWSAHKLELLSEHQLRHGEAVAIGMALDTRYAQLRGALDEAACERVLRTIARVGLPLTHSALALTEADGKRAVLRGIEEFREHLGGRLTVTLLEAVGRGVEVHDIDEVTMERAIALLG